jgi:hypothetical protein
VYYRFLGKNHLPFPYVHRICIFFFFLRQRLANIPFPCFFFLCYRLRKKDFGFLFFISCTCFLNVHLYSVQLFIYIPAYSTSRIRSIEREEERARKKEDDDDEEGECSPSLHIKRIIQPHFFFSRFY